MESRFPVNNPKESVVDLGPPRKIDRIELFHVARPIISLGREPGCGRGGDNFGVLANMDKLLQMIDLTESKSVIVFSAPKR